MDLNLEFFSSTDCPTIVKEAILHYYFTRVLVLYEIQTHSPKIWTQLTDITPRAIYTYNMSSK